jgi:hypothetical protein
VTTGAPSIQLPATLVDTVAVMAQR